MDKIAVLIPCRNEEQTIEKVISDFRRVLPEAVIYVYDNASSDETAHCAKVAGAVVRRENRRGKGNVIRRMFREIQAECYILVDGDDTYSAESADKMASRILNYDADMVIGDRLSSTYFIENKRAFHSFGNRLVRAAINTLFHDNIRDIMSGYRAFSYEFVKTFPVLSEGFEVETEMTIHALAHHLAVEHIVVGYRERSSGSKSKLRTIPDGLWVIATILSLFRDYRPFLFFGGMAALTAIISGVLFLPVLQEYFLTRLVPRFPTLIASGFIMLVAVLMFFMGILLQTMAKKSRKEFEIHYIRAAKERMERTERVVNNEELNS